MRKAKKEWLGKKYEMTSANVNAGIKTSKQKQFLENNLLIKKKLATTIEKVKI